MADGPALSVLVSTRRSCSSLGDLLEAMIPQVEAVGGELVIVSGADEDEVPTAPSARFVTLRGERDIMRLRARALVEARGRIIAIGEDHTFPTPGWTEAIVRAHAEQPEVPVILGCLANATTRTSAARANFLAFASPFTRPMPAAPQRPPPVSTVTMKRSVLTDADRVPGSFETQLLPRLFREGRIGTDDRILVDHHQAFGITRAMRNAFSVARASYGYAQPDLSRRERRAAARWSITNIAPRIMREARFERGRSGSPRRDLLIVAFIAMSTSLGAVVGALWGPGSAAQHSA